MDEGGLSVAAKFFFAAEAFAIGCTVFFAALLTVLRIAERRECVKVGGARVLRKCAVATHIFMCMSIGMAIFFAVALGGLNWIVGAFVLCLTWAFLFTLRVRAEYLWGRKHYGLLSPAEKSQNIWVVLSTNGVRDENEDEEKVTPTHEATFREDLRSFLYTVKVAVRHNIILYCLGLGIIIAISFLVTPSLDCMCIAFQPLEISSRWTRSYSHRICEKGGICNVHITVADSGSDLIANFHYVGNHAQRITTYVAYDTESRLVAGRVRAELYRYRSAAASFKMQNIEEEYRYVNWAELSNLTAAKTYYFVAVVSTPSGVVVSQEFKVRALPDGTTFSFIAGGDTSSDNRAIELMKIASSKYPNFALVGGDIAYDNGIAACYRRWDTWLSNWRNYMTTPDAYLIPTIYAIGNHEVGGFGRYDQKAPFYTAYFPQQSGLQSVDPNARRQYHSHRVGKNGLVIVLDSDILTPMAGAQAQWLEATLAAAHAENRTTIFVMYHGTMYNSGTSPFPTPTITQDGKAYWVPLFDRYNVTVVFENHYHNYKRTKPLRGDKVVSKEEGIVYLGDGAWGVNLNIVEPEIMPTYLEKSSATSHVFHAQVTPASIVVNAIDHNNIAFDTWSKKL